MEEGTSVVCRRVFYLGSLNINDLPRHFISMEEPKVITIGDVMDSTVMHINKGNPLFARESKGNPRGTQGNPATRIKMTLIDY